MLIDDLTMFGVELCFLMRMIYKISYAKFIVFVLLIWIVDIVYVVIIQLNNSHYFQMRELLDKYYPFGHATDMKPRGLKNLRLEGLFPVRDQEKVSFFDPVNQKNFQIIYV